MPAREDNTANTIASDSTPAAPPAVYWPACGALCDVMWWARRSTPVAQPAKSNPPHSEND